ncbi:MAG: RNA polymerase factor sigma-70 [Candidatus Schekmanbacteria bacterium]|nr:RNA polymerase factor sigma-70 [Candidatus Schekmanbacteria bacterium]
MSNPEAEPAAASSSSAALQDGPFIEDLRRQMIKFATLQLGNPHWAEDAVQEALAGAYKNAGAFRGHAALKTWVFAILKNKIADVLRQRERTVEVSALLREDESADEIAALFDERGFWRAAERPVGWRDPEQAVHDRQFWRVFETCLEALPPQWARVFMMRELIELTADEICDALGITAGNLHVTLHRARLRLRRCLERNWFAEEGKRPC